MGSGCKVSFIDVVFKGCSLIVLAGAQVTLNMPHFQDMALSRARLSVYTHGATTKGTVQGGTINLVAFRGQQCRLVHALEVSNLTINQGAFRRGECDG